MRGRSHQGLGGQYGRHHSGGAAPAPPPPPPPPPPRTGGAPAAPALPRDTERAFVRRVCARYTYLELLVVAA